MKVTCQCMLNLNTSYKSPSCPRGALSFCLVLLLLLCFTVEWCTVFLCGLGRLVVEVSESFPPPMFSLHIGSCHSYVNCVELWASPVGFLALHCLLPKRVLWVTDLPALFLCAVRSCSKAEYAFVWFLCDTALSLRYFLNTWTLTAMEFFLYMSS